VRIIRASYLLCLLLPLISYADSATTYIQVLGIAQDAGYPQTSCYRPHCMRAWENPEHKRLASSIAVVDIASKSKYIFDATPDFREQLYNLHLTAPDTDFRLEGIFLTHGHIGHYTGIMHLGHEAAGAKDVPVFAMPRMREYLSTNGPWSQLVNYGNIRLVPIEDGKTTNVSAGLKVTPLRVPHREEYTEAVGFRIEGPERTALFIPDIDKWERWDTDIRDLVRSVDYALLDGSFFRDGEIPGRAMEDIPHPFVEESMRLFADLTDDEKSRVIFIHLNNTNPLLIEDNEEYRLVIKNGFRIAHEGMKLPL
jgi:pyrroloquinoline quinone biosynthesis protein B